jgi:hypothetical protein
MKRWGAGAFAGNFSYGNIVLMIEDIDPSLVFKSLVSDMS